MKDRTVTDDCTVKAIMKPLPGLMIKVMGFSHYRITRPYGLGSFNLSSEEFEALPQQHKRRAVWPD